MKKERIEEIIENLKLEREKWLTLTEIESIVLNDGRGIYPNWIHMRFLITKDNNIMIKHGYSEPYGGKLTYRFSISSDGTSLSFLPHSVVVEDENTPFFRYPKEGDIIRSTKGCFNIIDTAVITKILSGANGFFIKLSKPIKMTPESRLSFYDPVEYKNEENYIHGTEKEGIYVRFLENDGKNKKYGIQHEIIKFKNIKEINLKLSKENRTYRLT